MTVTSDTSVMTDIWQWYMSGPRFFYLPLQEMILRSDSATRKAFPSASTNGRVWVLYWSRTVTRCFCIMLRSKQRPPVLPVLDHSPWLWWPSFCCCQSSPVLVCLISLTSAAMVSKDKQKYFPIDDGSKKGEADAYLTHSEQIFEVSRSRWLQHLPNALPWLLSCVLTIALVLVIHQKETFPLGSYETGFHTDASMFSLDRLSLSHSIDW